MSHALRNEAASMEVNFPDAARSAAHGSLLTRKKTRQLSLPGLSGFS